MRATLALLGLGLLTWAVWPDAPRPRGPTVLPPDRGRRIDAAPTPAPAPAPTAESLAWEALAFDHPGPIPPRIQALDGRQVDLGGHMIPLELTLSGQVTRFVLARYKTDCCFGQSPKITEWAVVEVEGGVHQVPTQTVLVRGRLRVGEVPDGNGGLMAVYRLTEARVTRMIGH